eukprot:gnl/Spiro4/28511_TR14096_c0_g1_i1.p1 gnl/Spiro4/28511_TR14096_c0_g1~~gnl/Spiro4/28511_TR14096_c0_g1_i1.p1  ORF type:complete len:139 (+),score=36.49 gnl/Spiro4/28511_TR14096_c0_g1_i1:49-417(+)
MFEEDEVQLGPDFQNAKCLMNSEVAVILECLQAEKQELRQSFTKTLTHVQRFSRYRNREAVKEVRDVLDRFRPELQHYEKALIGNLNPYNAEEARYIIPSLARISDEEIDALLADLSNFRKL